MKNLLTLIYPTKSIILFFLKKVLKMAFLKGDFSATNARIISSEEPAYSDLPDQKY